MAPLRLDDCQIHWVEQNKDRVLSLLSQKGNTKKKVHKALLLEPHHMEADISLELFQRIVAAWQKEGSEEGWQSLPKGTQRVNTCTSHHMNCQGQVSAEYEMFHRPPYSGIPLEEKKIEQNKPALGFYSQGGRTTTFGSSGGMNTQMAPEMQPAHNNTSNTPVEFKVPTYSGPRSGAPVDNSGFKRLSNDWELERQTLGDSFTSMLASSDLSRVDRWLAESESAIPLQYSLQTAIQPSTNRLYWNEPANNCNKFPGNPCGVIPYSMGGIGTPVDRNATPRNENDAIYEAMDESEG